MSINQQYDNSLSPDLGQQEAQKAAVFILFCFLPALVEGIHVQLKKIAHPDYRVSEVSAAKIPRGQICAVMCTAAASVNNNALEN